jgi:2-oxoglutarate dehydrogenase E2 component (dihydrolipoamide succinyltransferase)
MSIEVKIPAVGESITSGVLSIWHKQNGDLVKEGEALFTLETDKISTEIPANSAGRLQIQIDAGQEVKIGEVVALLDESAQAPTQGAKPAAPIKAPAAPIEAPATPTEAVAPAQRESNETLSPAARRIVEEEKVHVAEVVGTGKRGQVTKSDLVQFLESKNTPSSAPQPSAQPAPALPAAVAPVQSARTTRRKMTPLRKKIAAQLVMAQQNAAMLTTFNECDMTGVMQLRAQ